MTILISSHILSEIEQIADTIAVINNGRLVEEVSMEEIRGEKSEYIEIVTKDCSKAAFVLENNLNITNIRVEENTLIRIYDLRISQNEISKSLILNDVNIEAINKKSNSLEDHFLKLLKDGERSA